MEDDGSTAWTRQTKQGRMPWTRQTKGKTEERCLGRDKPRGRLRENNLDEKIKRDESEDERIDHIKNLLVVDGRTFEEPASGGHLRLCVTWDGIDIDEGHLIND